MSLEDLNNLTHDELLSRVRDLEVKLKKKKYGLVWEDRPEDIILKHQNEYPVLKRDDSKSIRTDNSPINVLIEGDNYFALQILNYTHKNLVDVIYIDPPYNTGNKDFIYNDSFVDSEDGYRHSKWLSFMEKRLILAKDLLKDTGVIFISIDDNELAQLKLLCDSIFGAANFIAALPTVMNLKGNQDELAFAGTHEYTLVYSKNKPKAAFNEFILDEEDLDDWFEDEYGFYKLGTLKGGGVNGNREKRPNLFFPIFVTCEGSVYLAENNKKINQDDYELLPISDGKEMTWRWSKNKINAEKHNIDVQINNGSVSISRKIRPDIKDLPTKKPKSLFYKAEYSSGNGTNLLKNIFGEDRIFNNPKPLLLIKDLIHIASNKDSLILDFFAGSGTTGHAVLELNREDEGSRKFILVTNNGDEKSDHKIAEEIAYKRLSAVISGYSNKKNELVKGLGGNLEYMKIEFVDKVDHTDSMNLKMNNYCSDILCLKEGVFNLEKNIKSTYRIYSEYINETKSALAIYHSLRDDHMQMMQKEIEKIKGVTSVYTSATLSALEAAKNIRKMIDLDQVAKSILNVYEDINRNLLNKR